MRLPRTLFAVAAVVLAMGFWASMAQAHPDRGCSSCHVPHGGAGDNSSVPLWNPEHTETALLANATYTPNAGSTDAVLTGPTGASKLCLSCHDGSYDHVTNAHSFMAQQGEATMGLLANSHPISFDYEAVQAVDPDLKPVADLPEGALDGGGDVQCVSCHDVHKTAADYGDVEFSNLRWDYYGAVVGGEGPTAKFCRNCHLK